VIWWATEPITPRPDLTCRTTYLSTLPERDTHPILIRHDPNSQRSTNSSISFQMRPTRVSLLRVFFFFASFFLQKKSVALLKLWEVKDFANLGTPVPKKSYHHLDLSQMRPNELWTCTDDGAARAQAPGCQRSSWGSVRRGKGGDRCSQRRR